MTNMHKRLERLEGIAECSQHGVAIIEEIPTGYMFKGMEYTPDGMERELAARGVDVVIIDDIPGRV